MSDDIKNLQVNHMYLIKFGGQETLFSIKVLLITDKAYNIKWNGGNETWKLKEVLYRNYSLVEDISDFVVDVELKPTILDVKTKLVQCYICHGSGSVPEPNSTAGTKPCPYCLGAKMIPEVTEITKKE